MSQIIFFDVFGNDVLTQVHDLQTTGDALMIALTDVEPDSATNELLGDITGLLEETNGYAPVDVENALVWNAETSLWDLTAEDKVITASGGDVGPFRYVVLYNAATTPKDNPLVGYWDYGSEITLADGETFTLEFIEPIASFG